MNFCSDNLSRMFEDDGTPVFCCDENWNILLVNDCMRREYPDYGVGFNAKDFSDRNATFFLNAHSRLSKGLLTYSTNFEISFQKSTICIFGTQEDSKSVPLYFCTLQIPEEEEETANPIITVTNRYRSPITDVMSSSMVLARKFEDSEDYVGLDYLNHTMHCCYSMLRTTTETQIYYKLKEGKYSISKKRLSVNGLMRDLCKTLDTFFIKSEYNFSYNIPEEEIISDIDEDLLALAIFHLIANGCNFAPVGALVSLSLAKSENENAYCITVTDEGDGIKTENLQKIFEPFYFLHSSPIPESRLGPGLGLPIVKAATEIHGGIVVVNSGENRSTSMVLKIPISDEGNSTLVLKSNTAKYFANKFSNSYILFSDICDIRFC